MRNPKALSVAAVLATTLVVTGASSAGANAFDFGSSAASAEHTVVFARHAESWTNIATEQELPPPVPISDPADILGAVGDLPLTEQGAAQARNLAQSMAGKVDEIYASAQLRTFQTARAVSIETGKPVEATWNLREINVDPTPYLDDWAAGRELDTKVGPENDRRSFTEMNDAFLEFWNEFADEHKGRAGTSLIVTHGGVMMLFAAPLCGDNPYLTPEFVQSSVIGYTGQIKATLHPDGTVTCTEWMGADITP
jgi:broad specificity phosphatase PhoE